VVDWVVVRLPPGVSSMSVSGVRRYNAGSESQEGCSSVEASWHGLAIYQNLGRPPAIARGRPPFCVFATEPPRFEECCR